MNLTSLSTVVQEVLAGKELQEEQRLSRELGRLNKPVFWSCLFCQSSSVPPEMYLLSIQAAAASCLVSFLQVPSCSCAGILFIIN